MAITVQILRWEKCHEELPVPKQATRPEQLSELDAVVTVYRGTHSDKPNSERALSWTLNLDTAQWFANRYGKDGKLYEAKIEKEHIHALFLRREESEVILDPKYLTEVVQVPKMEQGMDMEQTV